MKLLNGLGKRLATKSEKKFRHSALVLKGGALISSGYNKDARHAEIHGLRAIWHKTNYYRGATLISIRIKKNGSYGHSRPCINCMGTIIDRGISKIIFMDKKGNWIEERI